MWSASPPTLPAACFAQVRFDPELVILAVLAIVLIVAGCMVVVRVRSWRAEESAPAAQDNLLASYQALVERGELHPEEFEKIKARLEEKMPEPLPDTRITAASDSKPTPPPFSETGIQRPPGGA